jgi:hypothetical protein
MGRQGERGVTQRRRSLLAVASLVAVLLIAAFAVDGATRYAVQSWGTEATGGLVRVESAEVSLFEPQLVLHGLVVANPPHFEEEPALSVRRLSIGLDFGSVVSDVVTVTSLAAESLEIRYSRAGDEANLDVIEAHLVAFLEEKGLGSRPRIAIARLEAREATATAPVLVGRASVPLEDLEYDDLGVPEGGLPPPALVAAVFDLMEPSLANALAHTDYGGLLRKGAHGIGGAARKLKGIFD